MRLAQRGFVFGFAVVLLSACPEKKAEPPAPAAKAPEAPAPAPTPPPAAEVERAAKECAAPLERLPESDVQVGDRAAKSYGYRLTFTDKDADGALHLGVLGPVNEDSGLNLVALKKYLKFFKDEKADAIVVTGDVGEVADGIARALKVIAESKLPVLVIAGNRECRADFADGVAAARRDHANIVNMNEVRAVQFPELTLVSLPGYHDPNYITCAQGCRYFKSTVDEAIRLAKEATTPVMLVSHGPPHGDGSQALDYASAGGNVGDTEVNRAIAEGNIAFGVFSNIKEAGGRATSDASGTTQLRQTVPSKTLYLNPGPADTMGWQMNDNTQSVGQAALVTVKNGQASFKLFRIKSFNAQDKAEGKKLDPAPRDTAPADAKP